MYGINETYEPNTLSKYNYLTRTAFKLLDN